jgi:hypothetical protein
MAYSTRSTKFHGFLRKAFGEKPFTTWTIIIVLAALVTLGVLVPPAGIVLLMLLGVAVVGLGAMFVWAMIEEEWH